MHKCERKNTGPLWLLPLLLVGLLLVLLWLLLLVSQACCHKSIVFVS